MKKIEHIGIAVKDIKASKKIFSRIFGKKSYKTESVDSEGVVTSFFQIGDNKIELIAPKNEEGPISKYLSKHKEGMHHIAFSVEDIYYENPLGLHQPKIEPNKLKKILNELL